ncbi:MAG: hypothetical protein M3Y08_04690 [Fibrobacterota bacterium]|nr:hypothetical protein [Fibrobacterota bacterium]
MISESSSRRYFQGAAFAGIALSLACMANPVRAEDPLLGQIKVIKCVGCDPGSVNLIVHDPIDVRDFEVQIKEADFQKVITPLTGKTIYDKSGCFYWMDMPKAVKPSAPMEGPKDASMKDTANPEVTFKAGKKGMKKAAGAAKSDSAKTAPVEGLLETSAPASMTMPEGKPSRCIPYVKIEPKIPSRTGNRKDEE